ncbi:MAG: PAS domain S-box protein [Bacteroidales bacterium]|nr:PAS domain S-box protein [Bacteroidales bacterium]
MTKGDITDFIINVGILLIFRSIYDFYWIKYRETYKSLMQYATGIVVGATGILLMAENIGWYSGSKIFIDAKTVLLALSGLFLGARTTVTAALAVGGYAVYRFFVPVVQFYTVDIGTDVWNADSMLIFDLYTIIISSLCGILFYKFYPQEVSKHKISTLVKMAVTVHILMFLMTPVIIPADTIPNMLILSPTVLVVFPAATVLLGRLMITDASRWDIKTQLLYTEEKFNKVALCTDDCFWEMDSNGYVVYVSNSVTKIIGYTPEEIITQKPLLFVSDLESKNDLLEYAQSNNNDPTAIFDRDLVLQHKDGSNIHCKSRGIKRFDRFGNLAGYIGIIHNTNEQYIQHELLRRNQMQLREQNKQYEQLNNELKLNNEKLNSIQQELDATKEKLNNAELAQKSLIANISQEIKTPLATINSYLDTAARSLKIEDQTRFVSVVKQQNDDIMLLLNAIADMEKIDDGTLTLTETAGDIGYLFNEICQYYKLRTLYHNNKHIEFVKRMNIKGEKQAIKTDFDKLELVLKNLINNACRYTDKGEIRFNCSLCNNDTEILFEVSDTGIGIDEESLKNIFSRYYKPSVNTRGFGPSIGLPVSKAIIELLGGKIYAESKLGEGTSISFTIPYKKAPLQSPERQYRWKGKKAVVIAKDRLLSIFITNILMKTDINYKVYTLEHNRTLDNADNVVYDIALVDSRIFGSSLNAQVNEFLKQHPAPVVKIEQPENDNLPDSGTIYEAMAAILTK